MPAATRASTKRTAAEAPRFEDGRDFVQTLARGLEVIRAFDAEHPAMSLSELATRTGLARAVVRRLLLTLEHLGYVTADGRRFALTPRILDLGYRFLTSLDLPEIARPQMQALAAAVHESCSMAVLDGNEIVYVQRVQAQRIMRIALDVGARLPAAYTSLGRAIVSALPEAERRRWTARQRPAALTPFSITDRARLELELARCARQGFAYVEQELELGLCSVAVAIRDRQGRPVAALNVGMAIREPARARARVQREVLPALRRAAAHVETALHASRRAFGAEG